MYEEPYKWVEALASPPISGRTVQAGSPVVGLAYDAGIVLLTISKGTPKLYEIYDRLALGAWDIPRISKK